MRTPAHLLAAASLFAFATQAQAIDHLVHVGGAGLVFTPSNIEALVGDTVTFTNDGGVPHTVTATDGADFDSGTLAPGKTFSFVAAGHGKISYVCTIHPGMQGTIEVD